MLRLALSLIVLWVGGLSPALGIDRNAPTDPALQTRYNRLVREFSCDACRGQSLADAPLPFAENLRTEIANLMNVGQTDDDIRQYMTSHFGNRVTALRPSLNGGTIGLWLSPVLILGLSLGLYALTVLRAQQRWATPAPTAPE